ncbi:hypothetical protein PDESU_00967 [Pontiella desulfatans]|uniref:Helix-turn-helix domain-containing protein n=1 Tax=Pontiella desulfatans TaxID=2750659 RepID=A0A6C2TXQ3_PONDE|nr:helix-turn-helix domain-containing protein [Pontiella desulfatans]VGO12415.1 hypothetical protein PDESU_00967 [Pontiella desulfatans]
MKNTTRQLVQLAMDNDPEIDPHMTKEFLALLAGKTRRRNLISLKASSAILDCCELTVRRMVKRGQIHPIRFSARRIRYDEEEILRIASQGIAEGVQND